MSWISISNLRRFADKLFHSALTFDGSVTHNGADEFNGGVKVNTKPLEVNGGVKVNTTKAEFNAPVSLNQTTTYKGNEIATKADVSSGGSITVDDEISSLSTNPVQNKVIKDALDKKLSTTGGTVDGAVEFKHLIKPSLVIFTQHDPELTVTNSTTKSLVVMTGDKTATVLDEDNCNKYVPKLDGTGATGTWDISISGNALNDSEGNKIVDTYAKKSDIPTGSNITVDDALSATSTNPVQNMVVNGALSKKLSTDGGTVNGDLEVLGKIKVSSLFIGDNTSIVTLTGNMAREQDGKLYTFLDTGNYTEYVPKLDGNGHLIINGSELWIA